MTPCPICNAAPHAADCRAVALANMLHGVHVHVTAKSIDLDDNDTVLDQAARGVSAQQTALIAAALAAERADARADAERERDELRAALEALVDIAENFEAFAPAEMPEWHPHSQYTTAGECRALSAALRRALAAIGRAKP
jgi:hypothetical protein